MAKWIIAAGMIRSGSTLQYQLTSEIVERFMGGDAVGHSKPEALTETLTTHESNPGPLLIKLHKCTDEARELVEQRQAKVVYIYRDIRDVLVSYLNKTKRSFWRVTWDGNMRATLLKYKGWTDLDDILVSRYETVTSDLPGEVSRIANYLGHPITDAEVAEIAEKYTLDKQRSRIQESDRKGEAQWGNKSFTYDSKTLLHDNHIRSGEWGQWQVELSRFQIATMEYLAYDWLVDRDYPISQPVLLRKTAGVVYQLMRGFKVGFKRIGRAWEKYVLRRKPSSASKPQAATT